MKKLYTVLFAFSILASFALSGNSAWAAKKKSSRAHHKVVHATTSAKRKKKKRAHSHAKARKHASRLHTKRRSRKATRVAAQPPRLAPSVAVPVTRMKSRLSAVEVKLGQIEEAVKTRSEFKTPAYQGRLTEMQQREHLLSADLDNLQRSKATPAAAVKDFQARLGMLELQINELVAKMPPIAALPSPPAPRAQAR